MTALRTGEAERGDIEIIDEGEAAFKYVNCVVPV
jgi:hypothetical protein